MNTLKQKIKLICQKLNPCFNKIAQLRAKLQRGSNDDKAARTHNAAQAFAEFREIHS